MFCLFQVERFIVKSDSFKSVFKNFEIFLFALVDKKLNSPFVKIALLINHSFGFVL